MIKKIKTSLTVKIFLSTAILLIVVCLITIFSMAKYIPKKLSTELQKQMNELIPVMENSNSLEECYLIVGQFTAQSNTIAYVNDANGNMLYLSDNGEGVARDTDKASAIKDYFDDKLIAEEDDWTLNAEYPVTLLNDEYILHVQSKVVAVNQAIEAIWRTVPFMVLGGILLAVIVSAIYSHYITKPIVELSVTSQKMAQLNFETYGSSKCSDEIGILSASLNTLADNLRDTLAELKKRNSELEVEIVKERELEQKQRDFFSAASHDLKTPLTILIGHLHGILDGVGDYKNASQYIERSIAIAEQMNTLVQSLLLISRTENGTNLFTPQKADLSEVVRRGIGDMVYLAAEKGQYINAQIPEHMLCTFDRNLMKRIIKNLLSNAICYSPANENIYISLKSDDTQNIVFEIENTGVKIPEESMAKLFQPFYRGDSSRSRNVGGNGLGLYIVKLMLEQHDAHYIIENTGEGVKFTFQLLRK